MAEKETKATNPAPAYRPTGPVDVTQLPPPPPPSYFPPPPPPDHSSVMTPTDQSLPPTLGTPLQSTAYWTVILNTGCFAGRTSLLQVTVQPPPTNKSLLEAYLLAVLLGVFGAHHFYLGRIAYGIMYFFTFGLAGCGWLIDLLRLPCLVASVNKANREKYVQLQQLRQQQQQQWVLQQQQQQHGSIAAASLREIANVNVVPFEPRSLMDAYILWFPFGLFGFHHFYLRNHVLGLAYLFTFGLFGIGWLVDLFRMPFLVQEANSPRVRHRGQSYSQLTTHLLAFSPAGLMGGHHFYLHRPLWGILYFCTLGLLGVGWVFDWFRASCLVKRANAIGRGERSRDRKYLDDAYILCFPLGFLGLHHFYLRRYYWGFLYLYTVGIFGIGWLIDWFRLPCLLREYHARLELSQPLISTANGDGYVVTSHSGMAPTPAQVQSIPPVYPPVAGYDANYQTTTYPPAGYGTYHNTTYPPGGYGTHQNTTYPPAGYLGGSYPPCMAQGYVVQGEAPPSYTATMNARTDQ